MVLFNEISRVLGAETKEGLGHPALVIGVSQVQWRAEWRTLESLLAAVDLG